MSSVSNILNLSDNDVSNCATLPTQQMYAPKSTSHRHTTRTSVFIPSTNHYIPFRILFILDFNQKQSTSVCVCDVCTKRVLLRYKWCVYFRLSLLARVCNCVNWWTDWAPIERSTYLRQRNSDSWGSHCVLIWSKATERQTNKQTENRREQHVCVRANAYERHELLVCLCRSSSQKPNGTRNWTKNENENGTRTNTYFDNYTCAVHAACISRSPDHEWSGIECCIVAVFLFFFLSLSIEWRV